MFRGGAVSAAPTSWRWSSRSPATGYRRGRVNICTCKSSRLWGQQRKYRIRPPCDSQRI